MCVEYFATFSAWCDSVVKDESSLLTIGNDGSKCCVSENTMLTQIGDVSAAESSDVHIVGLGSSSDKSVT